MRACLAVGCGEPERSRALCGMHYDRARKAGLIDLFGSRTGACAAKGCERSALYRGWCHKHYTQVRRHGRPAPEREHHPAPERCAHPGCERPALAREMCQTHYRAWLDRGGWKIVMKMKRRKV